ncbi:hypothetical protein HU200_058067 [Digitaria exilis]|uniref:Uncharacterized protein n=1 Tax=Digitaria exilis TaxID=1010633 RepID=A0A835E4B8_9POAL|nr:hypothetical protein HU200_058067 [Digitaria exilis]
MFRGILLLSKRRIILSGTVLQDQTLHFNAQPTITTTTTAPWAPPLPIVPFTYE